MNKIRRNTILTLIAVIISFISLSLSLAALYKLNNTSGIASVTKWDWNMELSTISDINNSSNSSVFHEEPKIEDNVISYGITLGVVESYGQFNFQVSNLGNIDAKVKDIKIEGLEPYDQYVEVNLSGIEIGDTIKSASSSTVKVVTLYRNTFKGRMIKLDNIKITFTFTEDK